MSPFQEQRRRASGTSLAWSGHRSLAPQILRMIHHPTHRPCCRLLLATVAFSLTVGVAHGGRLVQVPGGASSFGIDPTRGVAYVANRGGIFTLDLSTSRLVAASALGPFDTIGDVDATTGLVAVYTMGGGPGPGIFDPVTGGVRSLVHGTNPAQGALFAGGLLYTSIFECLGFTCGPKLEALSFDGQVVSYLDSSLILLARCTARSADGSVILIGDTFDRTVLVVSTAGLMATDAFPVGADPCPIDVGNDQAVVAGNDTSGPGSARGSVVLLDLGHPRSVPQVIRVGRSFVRGVAIDPDHGRAYAVTSRANAQHAPRTSSIANKGGRLMTLTLDRWKVQRRTKLSSRLGAVQSVAVTPGGRILVGGENGILTIVPHFQRVKASQR